MSHDEHDDFDNSQVMTVATVLGGVILLAGLIGILTSVS